MHGLHIQKQSLARVWHLCSEQSALRVILSLGRVSLLLEHAHALIFEFRLLSDQTGQTAIRLNCLNIALVIAQPTSSLAPVRFRCEEKSWLSL